MARAIRHIALPAVAPGLFLIIAAIPVEIIGCRNRGLLAVAIAFVSLLGSLAAAVLALKAQLRKDPLSVWWVITCLILTLPTIALFFLA